MRFPNARSQHHSTLQTKVSANSEPSRPFDIQTFTAIPAHCNQASTCIWHHLNTPPFISEHLACLSHVLCCEFCHCTQTTRQEGSRHTQ
jgi:hypothetical protein